MVDWSQSRYAFIISIQTEDYNVSMIEQEITQGLGWGGGGGSIDVNTEK